MQGHDQNFVDEELEKVDKLLRHDLLQEKDQEQQDPKPIQLILTYNQFLPNLTAAIHKNWNILWTNKNLWDLFPEHPITAFKRNKNLKDIIGGTCIENGKVKNSISPLEQQNAFHIYQVQELYVAAKCWQQTHLSQQKKQTLHIFFHLNCKSEYVGYLMECILCKMKYVGKAKTAFNLTPKNLPPF